MTGRAPGPAASAGEIRAVRSGRFTISRLHRGGTSPYRVLLIGARSVVGAGGSAKDARWFAEHLADRSWLQLRRGIDLDVLWELRPVLRTLRQSVTPWRLWRYDIVVLVLTPSSGAARGLRTLGMPRLVRDVVERIARFSSVLLVALEPVGRHRSLPIDGLADAEESGPEDQDERERRPVRTVVVPHDPRAGADRVARALSDVARHMPPNPQAPPDPALEEHLRIQALAKLGITVRPGSPQVTRLTRSARSAFAVDLAAISIIEKDRVVTIATSGDLRATELPRGLALCNAAITSHDAVIIGDTWAYPALALNPLIRATPPVRFFAAYPLESIEGHRIGALCICDAEPRDEHDIDVELLRDLALLIEAEIATPRP